VSRGEVLVVGAGVVGASITYHLAARGVAVTVLDAADQPGGATALSAAQVRMHHSDRHDALLAALSLPMFERWARVVGGDCGFRQVGFAFLAGADRHEAVTVMAKTVSGYGVATQVLSPTRYGAGRPQVRMDGVGVVAYEARGGFADPLRTTAALLAAATRLGARVLRGSHVRSLTVVRGRVAGVRTASGAHPARHVVVAAGVHSGQICERAGIALPLRTRRIGWAVAAAPASVPNVVIDDTIGMYVRPHAGGGVLFGVPLTQPPADRPADLAEPSTPPADGTEVAAARQRLAARVPSLVDAPVVGTAAASEAYTPDKHALIGPAPDLDGLYVCTAFSGGGFKAAPAVGRAVAEELATGARRPELQPYRLDRFDRDACIRPDVAYRNM
jgi:glycine/D-amino acid oxidase-like deaminating enzyme